MVGNFIFTILAKIKVAISNLKKKKKVKGTSTT